MLKDGLGDGSANLRFSAATHFVDEYQCLLATTIQEGFHVLQVRTVGAQVVLKRLLVADVNKDAAEHAHVRVAIQRGQDAALHHVLHDTHSLEAHTLATSVWTRDEQDALLGIQFDV